MNVLLDVSVGKNQTKEKFWSRIEDYYCNNVTVPSNPTQGSLGHRWSTIYEQCCVDQVSNYPPNGVSILEYGPVIQELYKRHNKMAGSKAYPLHRCYKELVGNDK